MQISKLEDQKLKWKNLVSSTISRVRYELHDIKDSFLHILHAQPHNI